MTTATKSKLNSKLPGVAKIAFCSAAGKNMSRTLFTGENGKFSRKVGFQQKSKKYPYQIQYRQRSRYTTPNAKIKGADWTKWSKWKNAIGVTGIAVDATETASPVNQWMKANKGINKKGTYQTFKTFTNYKIPDNYDARQFEYRIRTFNKSKARHGNWTTQRLKVYKRAAIVDEKFVEATDGGLEVRFNYNYTRDFTIQVNSIVDNTGRELIKKGPLKFAVKNTTYTGSTTPTARTGYQGGYIVIPLRHLKRKVEAPEVLTADIVAVTGDGASTKLNVSTVYETVKTMTLTVTTEWKEKRGILIVNALNDNAVTLTDMAASVSYTYNGKNYSVPQIKRELNLSGTSKFYFYPPIGLTFNIQVKATNKGEGSKKVNVTNQSVSASGYRLNDDNVLTTCGVCWAAPTYEVNSVPAFETALPYGREKNIIFYGKGDTTNITLTGKIVDKSNLYGGEYGRKQMWDKVRTNQGVYWFRSSKGDMYKVGITGVDIRKSEPDIYELTVTMVEVV